MNPIVCSDIEGDIDEVSRILLKNTTSKAGCDKRVKQRIYLLNLDLTHSSSFFMGEVLNVQSNKKHVTLFGWKNRARKPLSMINLK